MFIITKTRKRIGERVKVKDSVTHSHLGCDAMYFEKNIKGMLLKIIVEHVETAVLEDSLGRRFTISKSNFEPNRVGF